MAVKGKHGTLVAATVTTVDLTGLGESLRIQNRGTTVLYYTVARSVTAATPTVAGDDTYALPAGCADTHPLDNYIAEGTVQVKLISSGTPDYSVEILP